MNKYDGLADELRRIFRDGHFDRRTVAALLADFMPGPDMERERRAVGMALDSGIIEALQGTSSRSVDLEIDRHIKRLEDRFGIREELAVGVVSAIGFGLGLSVLPSQRPLRALASHVQRSVPTPPAPSVTEPAPQTPGDAARTAPSTVSVAGASRSRLAIPILSITVIAAGAMGYFVWGTAVETRSTVTSPPPPPSSPPPPQPSPPPAPLPPLPASLRVTTTKSPGTAVLLLEKLRTETVPAARVIVASGDIVNTSNTPVVLGRIRFLFRDGNRNAIERHYDLWPASVGPRARLPFRQQIDDPPAGAVEVEISVESMR